MRRWIIVLTALGLLLAGCRSEGDLATLTAIVEQTAPVAATSTPEPATDEWPATPTPEMIEDEPTPLPTPDYMFDRFRFRLLNSNPYMVNTRIVQQQPHITLGITEQCVGEGYTLYNLRQNWAGQSGDEHGTVYMPITCETGAIRFHFGGVAGEVGYETTINVSSEQYAISNCLLIQAFGHYRIEDPQRVDSSYALRAWVNDVSVGEYWMESEEEDIEPFWTYQIHRTGTYRVRIALLASWNSSVPGYNEAGIERTYFDWYSFLVGLDTISPTHCD
ncbi:MAG: hypothetical protein GTO60_16640 [Gammaproteobacteria bacterium]|nr:hypothetical protein [Gammaproteobacteria bacterium]